MRNYSGTYETEIDINEDSIPIKIHYEYYGFCPGSTDGRYGPKLEPDEPAHIEIDLVEGSDGQVIELTDKQIEYYEGEILEHLDSVESSYCDDKYDDPEF